MIARIEPGLLEGNLRMPVSKSHLHRLLIAASLADGPTDIAAEGMSGDIAATLVCLRALGAEITERDGGFRVWPHRTEPGSSVVFDCRESGSTLRFLLPIASALGLSAEFVGEGRLPLRPNEILTNAMSEHGVHVSGSLLPIQVRGRMSPGRFTISGSVSSQYVTGLLMALPLLGTDSEIRLSEPLQSACYVDMTLRVLSRFGIGILPVEGGWNVPGGQRYRSPGNEKAEGDWSAACFYLAANAIGSRVTCTGLNKESAQADRRFPELLRLLGGTIDVSDTPDAVPALAVAAALHDGETRIRGAARLRLKESDRLEAVCAMLMALGARASVAPDGLDILGPTRFRGGTIDGCRDHRIVMAACVAATRAEDEVIVTDAEAVGKSYPAFFEHFALLGGKVHVE
ncbi:MAG: 3-phosphoshikimate 1-carboxyvinyltransferase [Clostridia bacterium]|nr:3-phosphoshikimate 1-carboxyvinyltransferase [Clostridia bacterium]